MNHEPRRSERIPSLRRSRGDTYGGYGPDDDFDDGLEYGDEFYGASDPYRLPARRRGRDRGDEGGGSLSDVLGAVGILAAASAVAAVGVVVVYRELRRGERLPGFLAGDRDTDGIRIREAVTIARPARELYDHWRDFENLSSILRHVESVEDLGGGRSHWEASGPLRTTFEWDARIVADEPGERISWRSDESSTVPTEGTVRFASAPSGEGTRLLVDLTYHPPLRAAGAAIARLFGDDPQREVADDLRRFKRRMERRSGGSPGSSGASV